MHNFNTTLAAPLSTATVPVVAQPLFPIILRELLQSIPSFLNVNAVLEIISSYLMNIESVISSKLTASQFEEALKQTNVGVWFWDLENNQRIRSEMANRLLGLEVNPNFTPLNITEIVEQAMHPEDRKRVKESIPIALQSKDTDYEISYRVIWPDESLHHIVTRGKITRDSNGKAIAMVGATLEVTQLKQLEQERFTAIRATEKEVRCRAEEAEAHRRQLEELVNFVCHEIRNPLNGIFAGHQWLRDIYTRLKTVQPSSCDYTKALDDLSDATHTIWECAEQMKGIVDGMLDPGRLSAGKIELHKKAFDPKQTIIRILTPLRTELMRKKIDAKLEVGHIDKIIESDELRLSQILSNLISNAIKFTENGKITITMSFVSTSDPIPEKGSVPPNVVTLIADDIKQSDQKSNQKYLKCVVADTGSGMDEKELAKLFNPFPQANVQTSRGGVGLGLVISKRLIELMDGKIAVSSHKGQGTTFIFTIACKLAGCSPILQRKSLSQNGITPDFSGKTILIVDDSEINRRILIRLLAPTNCTIHLAANGQEAVDFYKRNIIEDEKSDTATSAGTTKKSKIDLIFMDIVMPVMDGLEATRQILAIAPVLVVGLSANSSPDYLQRAETAGMVKYLTKPFLTETIFAAITNLLFSSRMMNTASPSMFSRLRKNSLQSAPTVGDSPLMLAAADVKIMEPVGGAVAVVDRAARISPSSAIPLASAVISATFFAAPLTMKRDSSSAGDAKTDPVIMPPQISKNTCWYNCWGNIANFFLSVRDCDCNCNCSSCNSNAAKTVTSATVEPIPQFGH